MNAIRNRSPRSLYNVLQVEQQYANRAISEGYLRSEVILGSNNVINFPILTSQSPSARITERRLKPSDVFIIQSIGIYLGEGTATPTATDIASAKLHTFPNSYVFTSSAAALQSMYNGYLEMRKDQTVYFDSYPMINFYRAGVAQDGLAASANTTVNLYVSDEWNGISYGMAPTTPYLIFSGQSNNEVKVYLPTAQSLAGDHAFAVFIAKGMLVQNGANMDNQ